MTPIFIPRTRSAPPVCKKCGAVIEINLTAGEIVLGLIVVAFGTWMLFVFIIWLLEGDGRSLKDIIVDHVRHVLKFRWW
jgi:hypothetical protein